MVRHGNLRASDDDRERIVARLHKAATEGRIGSEELEHRVSAALKAVTYGELDATVADLPGPGPGPRTRTGREPVRRTPARRAVSTVAHNPVLLLFALPIVAVTAAMVFAATIIWSVLLVVVLALGGHRRIGPTPLAYARRQAMRQARRRPGRHWA